MNTARKVIDVDDVPAIKALQYAAIGFAVFPLQHKSKRPLIDEWQHRASADPKVIREWWGKWPKAGIGVCCGLSDLVVMDVDPRNGGHDTFAYLQAERGYLWDEGPAIARTGRGDGGQHYFFRAPEGVRLPGKLGPGVDLLSGPRYVVLEPSIHPDSGRPYRWEKGCSPLDVDELPEFPQAWWTALEVSPAARTAGDPLDALAQLTPHPLDDTPENRERVKWAADALSADCDYHDWMRRVFAILSTGLPDAVEIAREWSMTADDRFDDRAFETLVDSYRDERRRGGDLIGPGTLFHEAKAAGWIDLKSRKATDAGNVDTAFRVIPAHEFTSSGAVSWLVRSLIQRDGLGVIFGEPASGKSFLVLDVSGAVALGREWRGLPVTGGNVVYIAAEGAGGFRKRLQALAKHHGVNLEDLPLGVIADAPNFLRDDDKALARAIAEAGGASLIVVDTLASVTPGGNENSAEDMGAVIARCKRLQTETGAFVLLVHHSGKNAANGARGWSGLRGAVDLEIEVTRDGEDRAARVSKQKDGEDGAVFPFRLNVLDLGVDEDGEPITSCVIEHVDEVAADKAGKDRKPNGKNQRIVFEVVEKFAPCSVDDVLKLAVDRMVLDPERKDKRRDRAREALEALLVGKFVCQEDQKIRLYGTDSPVWNGDVDGGGKSFEGGL